MMPTTMATQAAVAQPEQPEREHDMTVDGRRLRLTAGNAQKIMAEKVWKEADFSSRRVEFKVLCLVRPKNCSLV